MKQQHRRGICICTNASPRITQRRSTDYLHYGGLELLQVADVVHQRFHTRLHSDCFGFAAEQFGCLVEYRNGERIELANAQKHDSVDAPVHRCTCAWTHGRVDVRRMATMDKNNWAQSLYAHANDDHRETRVPD